MSYFYIMPSVLARGSYLKDISLCLIFREGLIFVDNTPVALVALSFSIYCDNIQKGQCRFLTLITKHTGSPWMHRQELWIKLHL